MTKRGRKSSDELAVAAIVSATTPRLPASAHLSNAEQVVWARIVSDQPASAFTETHRDMLEMYCQHTVQASILDDELKSFEREWLATDDGLKRYDKLLAMREREVRAASSLATRLRITRQATTDPKTIGRANANMTRGRRPWELTVEAKDAG